MDPVITTLGGQSGCGDARTREKSASVSVGENCPSKSGWAPAGSPRRHLRSNTGFIQRRVLARANRLRTRPYHEPNRLRLAKYGAGASIGTSVAEKNDIGARTVETHGRRRACATIGAAKVMGCVTIPSARCA